MRIAIDCGALGTPGDGIARYLGSVLARLLPLAGGRHEFRLYARRARDLSALPIPTTARMRCDGLPPAMGKVASLLTSMPCFARLDRPHVHWGPAHRLPAGLPAATARVVTIHDLCWLRAPDTMRAATRRMDRFWMPRALAAADRIVCVSAATAADLTAAFPAAAGRTRVIHEAANPALPVQATPPPTIGERPFVLFVGTIEPRKNLPRLIEAFARCQAADGPQADLVLAGRLGWERSDLRAQALRLGIADRVHWLGGIDDAVLAQLYRDATCLALPSLYEGFGLTLLEGMRAGLPCLTSAGGATAEVAADAALLVDPLSVDEIADGLCRLLRDATLRAELARRGMRRAAEFSWERAAADTLAVLEEAAAERR